MTGASAVVDSPRLTNNNNSERIGALPEPPTLAETAFSYIYSLRDSVSGGCGGFSMCGRDTWAQA